MATDCSERFHVQQCALQELSHGAAESELRKEISELSTVVELKEEQLTSRNGQYQREKRRAEVAEELQAVSVVV